MAVEMIDISEMPRDVRLDDTITPLDESADSINNEDYILSPFGHSANITKFDQVLSDNTSAGSIRRIFDSLEHPGVKLPSEKIGKRRKKRRLSDSRWFAPIHTHLARDTIPLTPAGDFPDVSWIQAKLNLNKTHPAADTKKKKKGTVFRAWDTSRPVLLS
eukprot:gene4931-2370_t